MVATALQMRCWLREGRGCGHGVQYRPWLQVQDVLSIGHAHKVPGIKTARTYHVFSDLEALCLTVLEFQHDVVDIREQFPLLPTELTERAAERLKVRHPVYAGTSTSQVLTTDFCADIRISGRLTGETALAVKYSRDLGDPRTRELLAIEREANLMASRRWLLFTEVSIPSVIAHNLAWLRRHTLPCGTVDPAALDTFCVTLREFHRPDISLEHLLTRVSKRLDIMTADGLQLLASAGWYQHLVIRLDVEMSLKHPLALAEHYPDLLRGVRP